MSQLNKEDGSNDAINLDYELCLVSLTAMDFYQKNKDRLVHTTLQEYSNHAIKLIDYITEVECEDEGLRSKAEIGDMREAALNAKNNVARARNTVEDEDLTPERRKVARSDGGFWWFYKQVIEYTVDRMSINEATHTKTRPTLKLYDHTISVSFKDGTNNWGFEVEVVDHNKIRIVGSVNGSELPDQNNNNAEAAVCFLLMKIARIMALENIVVYLHYIANEAPAAKRSKAIARFLKGDYTKVEKKESVVDKLELDK